MKSSLTIAVCLFAVICLAACEVVLVTPPATTQAEAPSIVSTEQASADQVSIDEWIPDNVSPKAQTFYRTLFQYPDYSERIWKVVDLIAEAENEYGVVYTTEPINANGVEASWIRTAETKDEGKALLYFHGGAYISRWVVTPFAVAVAHESGTPVLSVDYRLAPDYPFPAAVEDTTKLYQWLLTQGYEAKDIAIFGDSAGGGLTLATVLALQAAGQPLPAAVALASPWTDLTLSGDAYEITAHLDPIQTYSVLDNAAAQYADETERTHPHLSPLFADYSADFPPMLIQVGTREIFLTDASMLAQVARQADVEVTLDVWAGMWHIWHYFPNIPEGLQANREMSDFLKHHLGD
ncbi:alpha/beta hydrolase [Chloroflexi bacterium TSY]|nr:alpha/beta hydrolase [Chloroflexi bacterium TSY]